jgi:uncharacterized protein
MKAALPFAVPAAAVLLGFAPAPATAASFDCARAIARDEVAICRTPALSAMDSEMGALWFTWSRVPMLMGSNGDRGDEAQEFLVRRGACGGNVGCIAALYRRRNADLRSGIDAQMADFERLRFGCAPGH